METEKRKIVQRNVIGKVIAEKIIKKGETPNDKLLNMLLYKDIVLVEGDSITIEVEEGGL